MFKTVMSSNVLSTLICVCRYVREKKAEELARTESDLEKLREKTRECEETREQQSLEIKELQKDLSEQKVMCEFFYFIIFITSQTLSSLIGSLNSLPIYFVLVTKCIFLFSYWLTR